MLVLTTGTGPLGAPPWENADQFEQAGANRMYMNESGTGFSLASLRNHDPEPYSCCAAFIDLNLDFKEDLYIVNDFGMYVEPNQLFYGEEDGELVPHVGSGIDVGMYGMGLAVGAFNGDQYPDFVVSDWKRNWLFLSDGYGEWYDATQQYGFVSQQPDQHVGWGVEFPDVDNDGDLDIWVGYGHLGLDPETQEGLSKRVSLIPDTNQILSLFKKMDSWWMWLTYGESTEIRLPEVVCGLISTMMDFWIWLCLRLMDLFKPIWQTVMILLGFRIQLRQPNTMNTRAVGARIKVTTKQGKQLRWILAGSSLSSSAPLEAHFGLGEAGVIREIEIILMKP